MARHVLQKKHAQNGQKARTAEPLLLSQISMVLCFWDLCNKKQLPQNAQLEVQSAFFVCCSGSSQDKTAGLSLPNTQTPTDARSGTDATLLNKMNMLSTPYTLFRKRSEIVRYVRIWINHNRDGRCRPLPPLKYSLDPRPSLGRGLGEGFRGVPKR